jgi:phosphoglycerate dehydrogenase-like enzyme
MLNGFSEGAITMERSLPEKVNVVILNRQGPSLIDRIKAIDPRRLEVFDVWPDFYDELAGSWSFRMMERLGGPKPETPARPPEEAAAVLREAHVMLAGLPYPRSIRDRVPNLLWAHFGFAGVSNLVGSEFWDAPFLLTSGRGYSGARPIAESVIAATMMHARRLDLAVLNTNPSFDPTLSPAVVNIEGKTMGIIGLGGIGANVAKMARGIGMRVVATRQSAQQIQQDVDGVDVLYPAAKTHEMLGECDVVAVCAMLTAETEGMFNEAAFAAIKPGAYFINVARGELVLEKPLIDALKSGHLGGAYLDTWPDDMARLPDPELLTMPGVTITPHVSQQAETNQNFGNEVFCDNLTRLLKGEALVNVVDWKRGY